MVRGRSSVQSAQRTVSSKLILFFRYGVVGNMSGSHPVASGSIPGIGSFVKLLQVRLEEFFSCFSALLAQLAERNPPKVEAVGSIPTSG